MKTIAFERSVGQQLTTPPAITLIADSAPVAPGNPVFLPQFAGQWQARVYLAFRIGRLGKGISAKFAPRYRDAVTLAMKLQPVDMERQLLMSQLPAGIVGLFDNCVAFGQWGPIAPDANWAVECEGASAAISLEQSQIDRAIQSISSYATLKTGDVIMPIHLGVEFAVSVGDTLAATLNGSPVLNLRFK